MGRRPALFGTILVGLDGSPGSRRALAVAVAPAEKFGAALHALTIIETGARVAGTVSEIEVTLRDAEDYARRVQAAARQTAAGRRGDARGNGRRRPRRADADRPSRAGDIDPVVVGQSGHSRVWGTFLGTTTDKLSHHAACSVLIVR